MHERRKDLLDLLRRLVEHESPSSDKKAVDRLVAMVAGEGERLGARVRRHRAPEHGDHLQMDFDFGGRRGARRLLVLGHTDTVWEAGTLEKMPFRVNAGRAYGPGIFDMKGGLAQALFALAALRDLNAAAGRAITCLLVSDEEIGSPSSRAITQKLAKEAAAVLVAEPAAGVNGALKTARKGCGDYRIDVFGQAAHSGLDFASGVNTAVELARQISKIARFTRLKQGTTVSVNVIGGGTRDNVVPDHAWARVDVRVVRLAGQEYLREKFASLKPFDPRVRLEVKGGIDRPPMERTPEIAALFQRARDIARELGFDLKETAVGGGSDGNLTAAMGVPTLDGLGAVGDGAHATHEHVIVDELPRRAALFAHLLRTV